MEHTHCLRERHRSRNPLVVFVYLFSASPFFASIVTLLITAIFFLTYQIVNENRQENDVKAALEQEGIVVEKVLTGSHPRYVVDLGQSTTALKEGAAPEMHAVAVHNGGQATVFTITVQRTGVLPLTEQSSPNTIPPAEKQP